MVRRLCFLFLLLVLGGCRLQEIEATRLVEVTRVVTVVSPAAVTEVTRVVVVTATPPAGNPATFAADNPQLYTAVVEDGPQNLDPALASDPASLALLHNVLEPLLTPHPTQAGVYIPLLAQSWDVGAAGRTITFTLRPATHFSDNSTLTATDVAYTVQRALLQGAPESHSSLLLQPLLGYATRDITEGLITGPFSGNQEALVANTSDRDLVALCERVKATVTADAGAGTVTFHLAQPWEPFLSLLSQPWMGILNQEWAVQQGAWDGECDSWQQWYGGSSPLATTVLGTGPYVLDHWTPGVEYVLSANEHYWRPATEEMWPGGPAGLARIDRVRVQLVSEDHHRWELLRNGLAENAALSPAGQLLAEQLVGAYCDWQSNECSASPFPAGPLRRYQALPQPAGSAFFFNFTVNAEENAYLGSGQLDGRGIPPDFFSDVFVRRGFAHCFDQERFAIESLGGNALPLPGLFPDYLWPEPVPAVDLAFSLQLCREQLAQAADGQLPTAGFQLQIPIPTGDLTAQTAAMILQENLQQANAAYRVEIVSLPQSLYLDSLRRRLLPLAIFSWEPAVPDPHYWLAPPLNSAITDFQGLPHELNSRLQDLLAAAASAPTLEARQGFYESLSRLYRATQPFVLLPQPAVRLYQQRWVQDWIYNPAVPLPYYYAYALNGS